MTIGEKLEEARKRKGITIREAAEATKVRGDYLLAMENNSFEISLPEVYVKGFLKIYINYLRLDTEKLMAEYDSLRQTSHKPTHIHNVPLQHDVVPSSQPGTGPAPAPAGAPRTSFGHMDIGGEQPEREKTAPSPLPPGAMNLGGASWLRPAILIGGIVVVVAVIAILVVTMTGSGKPELNPEMNSASSVQKSRPITLIASGTVVVRVIKGEDVLFDGTLTSGQTKTFDAVGQVEVRYNSGQNLVVERDGQRQGMGKSGLGRSIIQ